MKTLFILRHAKAEEDSDSGKDFDRPLAERGWSDARAIGRAMRERGPAPDMILSSPARRASETASALIEGHGAALALEFDRRLYNATPNALLEVIGGANGESLMLVGHNPGVHHLVLTLTDPADEPLRQQAWEKFPTAALAMIALPIDYWNEVGEGTGHLEALLTPKELRT
jgi:phosphohistidine phosphatase